MLEAAGGLAATAQAFARCLEQVRLRLSRDSAGAAGSGCSHVLCAGIRASKIACVPRARCLLQEAQAGLQPKNAKAVWHSLAGIHVALRYPRSRASVEAKRAMEAQQLQGRVSAGSGVT